MSTRPKLVYNLFYFLSEIICLGVVAAIALILAIGYKVFLMCRNNVRSDSIEMVAARRIYNPRPGSNPNPIPGLVSSFPIAGPSTNPDPSPPGVRAPPIPRPSSNPDSSPTSAPGPRLNINPIPGPSSYPFSRPTSTHSPTPSSNSNSWGTIWDDYEVPGSLYSEIQV